MHTYKYLRYTTTDGYPINLSDIAVYEDSACIKEVPIRLLTPIDKRFCPEHITDHNMMTAFCGPSGFNSMTFELRHNTHIGCIDFYPQNDANFIIPGDTYELFYQNGTDGWQSLGRRTDTGETVSFMAPDNALLWLRHITHGKEEQVFIYENGRQYFLYNMK